MIDTVVFDFDGTVMNTNKIIIMSWQHTFNEIRGHDGDMEYILGSFGEPLEYSMRNTFPEVPVEESIKIYRDYHRDKFYDTIELFPGIIELMSQLKSEGIKTGLATSRLKVTTYQGLEKYDLFRYLDNIITVEDVDKAKPDPEILYASMKNLNSDPENTLMLGDTKLDIACANNAGVTSVLVGWSAALAGKTKEDFTGNEIPDHIIDKPIDLMRIIR
ncbi:MAG: HAD-IA family hydrolase [Bacillota bacterium]|nr:HAD-IA family hydrolase [Bacillota bacterium]